MSGTDVSVQTADGPMTVHVERPDGRPRGAVVVIQEAFGVNDHIEDVARRFADEGFLGAAPHLYHRTGDAVVDYSDFFGTMPHMQALTRDGLSEDLDATLALLAEDGIEPRSVGVVGFCLGGSVSLLAGVEQPLGAAVTYYGGGHGGVHTGTLGLPPLVELAPDLRAPWIGHFGDLDEGLPADDVEALRAAAERAAVRTEVYRYPGAEHGFNRDVGAATTPRRPRSRGAARWAGSTPTSRSERLARDANPACVCNLDGTVSPRNPPALRGTSGATVGKGPR